MSESQRGRVVIVGAGMAGVQTAVHLRQLGFDGPVRLLGAEPHPPYDRPPLSKAVLLGQAEESAFEVDFAALDVELELGREVTGLRADQRLLVTDAGPVAYDWLVLATGAVPRALPGAEDTPGAYPLHTLDDVVRLRPLLAERRPTLVVGAGWIGAEFTTAARTAGCPVTVVEAGPHPLPGVLPAEVAEPMRRWYEEVGATLLTGRPVRAVHRHGVTLEPEPGAEPGELSADAVVVGVGSRPATDWLAGSGVERDGAGAVTADAWLRTSVPGVYAVGDCASFPSARYGRRLLVHHWDNALRGSQVVAANLLAESRGDTALAEGVRYDPVPYFWSEQFGRFVQYAGHHADGDLLLWRGDPGEPAWSVCWLRREPEGDRLVALLAVGRPRDLTQGRKLIEGGARLDPTVAADASVPLKKAVTKGA
ncbi:FAD-dependent oxidoreductase [Streptomyces sp. NPDC005438]|uniref:NAD(P)/FAD-dependent oxidoreductase n=1 Tax=Streptomyces sp. NPDC005438 TaxID=3156880 RepID=UPI0033B35763